MKKNNLISFLIVIGFFNLVILDILIFRSISQKNPSVLPASTSSCPAACVDLIQRGKSAAKEIVIPISASGSTVKTEWTEVAGSETTFNKENYPGAKKIIFQANLSTDASDKIAYARLYDTNHGVGVQTSEISTHSLTLTQVVSQNINPFSGDLKLRIQLKSLNGNLVTISNPRILVTY